MNYQGCPDRWPLWGGQEPALAKCPTLVLEFFLGRVSKNAICSRAQYISKAIQSKRQAEFEVMIMRCFLRCALPQTAYIRVPQVTQSCVRKDRF
jgi:hypothetical protein